MRNMAKAAFLEIVLLASAVAGLGQGRGSLAVVFKDGHRKNFSVAEITRIEFRANDIVVVKNGHEESFPLADVQSFDFDSAAASSFPLGRNHFVGKWKVGQGPGAGDFYITLEANGEAHKTLGSDHGTWTVVDGEAHIAWDDGWHDAIRKVGTKHEKVAFDPGKSFSDDPNNVTDAVNTTAEPI